MRPRLTAIAMALGGLAASGCPHPKPVAAPIVAPPRPAPSPSASVEPPLGEVTLQGALEAAWDGDFVLCYKRARTAITIAPTDAETMELMLRCARGAHLLTEATTWVHGAYGDANLPVVRYADGIAALLRGEIADARRLLEAVGSQLPAAAYQAAIAAESDDDLAGADADIAQYLKVRPNDPAARALQARVACDVDLLRCASVAAIVVSNDDDETAVVRRLGIALPWKLGAPIAVSRATFTKLDKEAARLGWVAFDDAYGLAAAIREGGDPAVVLVRSPRSGRSEPGPNIDLIHEAHPIASLPFFVRVAQLEAEGDPKATQAFSTLVALFPTDLSVYSFAARTEHTATLARHDLENGASVRWRVLAASELARSSEVCELATALPADDHGARAAAIRIRCDLTTDPTKARKASDARLAVSPVGARELETAIDVRAAQKDAAALEAIVLRVIGVVPTSTLIASALWAEAELSSPKKARSLFAEALSSDAFAPERVRRLLRRYVEAKDITSAKLALTPSLVESPLDPLLCGVEGEILAQEGKVDAALGFLAKACTSARARREQDVLSSTIADIGAVAPRAKDKVVRDAALKCARGE